MFVFIVDHPYVESSGKIDQPYFPKAPNGNSRLSSHFFGNKRFLNFFIYVGISRARDPRSGWQCAS